MALTGGDGECCEDFFTEDRIVARIPGELGKDVGHLRPFPLVASHDAASR